MLTMRKDANSGAAAMPQGLLWRLESCMNASRGHVLALLLAISSSLLLGLGSIGPWGAREKRLAACVADVVRQGNWMVPQLWGRPRLEKPPLPYWLIASGSLLTGELNEWTLRVPGIVAALLIITGVYWIAGEAGGRVVALLAPVLLLSSIYFAVELRSPSSDLFLTSFTTASLACWWRGYRYTRWRTHWWTAAGICCALAMSSKGPVALAVIFPPIVGLLAWQRELALPRSRAAWLAISLALTLGSLWAVAALAYEPEAWLTWIQQLDDKISSPASSEPLRGFAYYLLQWPQYLFPWSVLSIASIRYGFHARESSLPLAVRYAWFWFFGNLVVFGLFAAHKIYYLMPAVPGLAILSAYAAARLGRQFTSRPTRRIPRWVLHGQLALLSATLLVLALVAWFMKETIGWIGPGLALAMAAVCITVQWMFVREGRLMGACPASGLAFCVAIGLCHSVVLPRLDHLRSPREYVARMMGHIPEGAPLYFWGEPDPSWWFYLDRPICPVELLRDDQGRSLEAYFLVAANDLGQEPAIVRRMEILATTGATDPNLRTVLARMARPVVGLPVFAF